MRKDILVIPVILLAIFAFSCKTKCKADRTKDNKEQVQEKTDERTIGTVSHQYRKDGCATVIIVKIDGKDKPLTLIPSEALTSEIDVDGQKVRFNYQLLKMRNPDGCTVGIPAEISNISKQ